MNFLLTAFFLAGLQFLLYGSKKHSMFWAVIGLLILYAGWSLFCFMLVATDPKDSNFNAKTTKAKNVYQNFNVSAWNWSVRFALQAVLMWVYFRGLFQHDPSDPNSTQAPLQTTNFQTVYYALGAAIAIVLQTTNNFWGAEATFWHDTKKDFSDNHWHCRLFISVLINALAQNMLLSTMPMMLMLSSDDMDFIKNAVSVAFITTIDDIADTHVYVGDKPSPSACCAPFPAYCTTLSRDASAP